MKQAESRVVRLRPEVATKRRVLVVEDNLDSVHSMAMLIKTMGHEVRFAINGFAALELAREFRPDVILLDIGLPDFKGDGAKRPKSPARTVVKTPINAAASIFASMRR